MADKVIGVIPARLDSKRFYGKVLFNYRGKPLIQYLHAELTQAKEIDRLIIATDNAEVKRACEGFGAEVIMTPKKMRTGSDRVAEVMKSIDGGIFVNVQGDAFGLNYQGLDNAIRKFKSDSSLEYGTLARKLDSDTELNDSDAVKVVLKKNGDAGWFSRSPIPFMRNAGTKSWTLLNNYYYHIGVYFYRRKALKRFAQWTTGICEKAESLEQLRILENGGNIRVFMTNMKTISIDSPKDVKKLGKVLN
ncbi:MAG TPA: 3-deoxy-manno-octulosonate cytidylyltransferase [candidate division Zixibacteria bacterium]|nr:3-deoxy-manno-octulosonate cytidylyltransferase [candidate division Zixibacteria bacterium]